MSDPNQFSTQEVQRLLRGENARERMLHRLHGVALVLGGLTPAKAAELLGDSPRAVAYWVEKYKLNSTLDLLERKRTGRPKQLDAAQLRRLRSYITTKLKTQNANGPAVRTYIKESFGVDMTPRHCQRIINSVQKECS